MVNEHPLLILVGPTAVGKTALSLQLAEELTGEIISGDSMQVYRGMDIGTAKVSREERARIPHHLIDIRNPDEGFSVSEFQRLATRVEEEIRHRGHLPLVVGGTGLYIRSLTHGYRFAEVPGSEEFRRQMGKWLAENSPEALHERLARIDPESATALHPNDTRRVLRALEVFELSGVRWSEWQRRQEHRPQKPFRMIGLALERERLYQRINERVMRMVKQGWVEEVEGLLSAGYSACLPSMQSLGYKEITSFLEGKQSLPETIDRIQRNTRRFAKRQLTWFRRQHEVDWVYVDGLSARELLAKVKDCLAGNMTGRAE